MSLIEVANFYAKKVGAEPHAPHYDEKYMKKWGAEMKAAWSFAEGNDGRLRRNDLLKHYRCPSKLSRENVKMWLVKILRWGNGFRNIPAFLKEIEADPRPLDGLVALLRMWQVQSPCVLAAVTALAALNLPRFRMAFGSKLLMFWDPNRFVVLDAQVLAKLRKYGKFPKYSFKKVQKRVDSELKLQISKDKSWLLRTKDSYLWSEARDIYPWWCGFCYWVAQTYGNGEWKASDVERLYFSDR